MSESTSRQVRHQVRGPRKKATSKSQLRLRQDDITTGSRGGSHPIRTKSVSRSLTRRSSLRWLRNRTIVIAITMMARIHLNCPVPVSAPTLLIPLNSMWPKAAAKKPVSGARMRTTLDRWRRPTTMPMPMNMVKVGWPKLVRKPRR